MKKLPTPIQPLCCAVPDLTPQTKEITMGQIKKENPPQMSCCYGIMVFLGLFASLLTLTLLVIYAGVWTQRSLYGKTSFPFLSNLMMCNFWGTIFSGTKNHVTWGLTLCGNEQSMKEPCINKRNLSRNILLWPFKNS